MRIGFDISDLATGRADGTTRYTYELAKRLPMIGSQHQWHFFSPGEPHRDFALPQFDNVTHHLSPWPKYWTQSRLPYDLFRYPTDVLFMPIQQLPFVRPARMKTVAVVHDLAFHLYPEHFTYKDWALQHIFSAHATRHADQLIAVSQSTADDIERFYGRKRDVRVVHHAVDAGHFFVASPDDQVRARQRLLNVHSELARPYVLYVGQIQPRKNLIRLVEAFEQLAAEEPELQLVIAGGHGWLQQPIQERIERSSHRGRIHRLGRVASDLLPAFYANAQVTALVSLYEGFGMPLLEAMACGSPVVAANNSSMPEVVGERGVLVDATSAEDIARGLRQARTQGLQPSGTIRSWDDVAQETMAILEPLRSAS